LPVEVPKYQVYGKQELGQNRWYSIQQEAQEKWLSRSNNTLRYTNSYESSDMASNTNQLSNVSLSMVWAWVWQQDASVWSISTSIKRVVIFMVAIGALLFLLWVSRIYLYKNTEFEHRYQTAKRIRKRWIRIVLWGVCVWFITVIITVFTS
jgi:phenylpropionate dioxygenase-like ring-hydroxylating dioxygenase large terminal subunit